MSQAVQKKVRTPQVQRTAEMKARLSQAAFEVICEVGYASFRTSAVSKKAGVSQGAQLHHFPTKNDLAVAAMEYAYSLAYQAFEQNIAAYRDGDDLIDAIVKDAESFYFSDSFMVALDILMAGGKDASLRSSLVKLAQENRFETEKVWAKKLKNAGYSADDAREVTAGTYNLVRGYAIRKLISEDTAEYALVLKRWKESQRLN